MFKKGDKVKLTVSTFLGNSIGEIVSIRGDDYNVRFMEGNFYFSRDILKPIIKNEVKIEEIT